MPTTPDEAKPSPLLALASDVSVEPRHKELQALLGQMSRLWNDSDALGCVKATLYANFLNRETFGVQLAERPGESCIELLIRVLEALGREIEHAAKGATDADA